MKKPIQIQLPAQAQAQVGQNPLRIIEFALALFFAAAIAILALS